MMTNSPLDLNAEEILLHAHGKLLHRGAASKGAGSGPYSAFCYDSRKAAPGSIFVCIPGTRVDGHDFIAEAVQGGVELVLGQNVAKIQDAAEKFKHVPFILVPDVLVALQKIATHYRAKFPIPTAALTGSSGKTTTKDLASSILNPAGSKETALITEGTLNNHWGVPQTVLQLRRHHRSAIFELGTSGFGEIDTLAAICQPDIGLITTVGASHLEKLRDEEGVLRAKRELFDWIGGHAAKPVLIFNLDDPRLEKLHEEFRKRAHPAARLLTLSRHRAADFRAVSYDIQGFESRFGWEYEFATPWGTVRGTLPLPGAHNLMNALAAAALVLTLGQANADQVAAGLANPRVSKLRSDIFLSPEGAIVYDDSYNSNPSSVAALLEAAREIRVRSGAKLQRTVAAVGDMLELGDAAADLHKMMGHKAAQGGVDLLLATGKHAADWVAGYRAEKRATAGAAFDFGTREDLIAALKDAIKARPKETLVLIKGSRGAKMDEVARGLRGK